MNEAKLDHQHLKLALLLENHLQLIEIPYPTIVLWVIKNLAVSIVTPLLSPATCNYNSFVKFKDLLIVDK